MKKIILMLFLPFVLYIQQVDAREIKKVSKAKQLQEVEDKAFLLGGVGIIYDDRRIEKFRLNCENLNTGKMFRCFGGRFAKYELFNNYGRSFRRFESGLYRLDTGKYRMVEMILETHIKTKGDKKSLDKQTLDLRDLNIVLDLKAGAHYLGNLNFDIDVDNFFRPRIAYYSIERSLTEHVSELNKKIVEEVQPLFAYSILVLDEVKEPIRIDFPKIGRWSSLEPREDRETYCYKNQKKYSIGLSYNTHADAVVDDGKMYISTDLIGSPVFSSAAFSKSFECGVFQHMRDNDFSEFRQKSRVKSQRGKSMFGNDVHKSHVFEIEFR